MKTLLKLKVEVTENDIEQGVQNDCSLCPISLAATRALNQAGFKGAVRTDDCNLVLSLHEALIYTGYSKTCYDFMERFDNGRKVKPFKFTLIIK